MSDRTENPYSRAAAVAITILICGLAASLAGNIQSINLKPESPGVGAYISAVWWPLVLFGMIELAIHVPWSSQFLERLVLGSSIGTIAGLAFYISYFHLAHVLSDFGYDKVSTYVGPLAVDLAMLVATMALRRIAQEKRLLAKLVAKGSWPRDLGQDAEEDLGQTEPVANGQSSDLGQTEPVANGQSSDLGQTEEPPALAIGQIVDLGQAEPVAKPTAGDGQTDQDFGQSESPHIPLSAIDIPWNDLDWDGQLKDMAREPAPEPEPVIAPPSAPEPPADLEPAPTADLVRVPAAAEERIRLAFQQGTSGPHLTALDKDLVAEGIAPSTRTARRWRGAVRDGKALVS